MKTLFCLFLLSPLWLFSQQTAAIKTISGKPVLFLNNQPELPFLYALTHVTGGRWSWEELPAHNLKIMGEAGVRLFQVDLWLQDIWQEGHSELDMALARKQLRGVLDACPGAAIILRIHVNAPPWWLRLHPSEAVEYADGPADDLPSGLPFNNEDGDILRARRTSLASLRWRQEAGAKLREFCRALARTREGAAVVGMHLAGGVYGEWHPWGFIWNEPDVSAPMTAVFRKWLKDKYSTDQNLQASWHNGSVTLENASAPDTLERKCCASGFFRDPEKEQRVMDYLRCQQTVVAEDIEYFCRTVKENWPRPLITGVFYGYIHFGLCRESMNGHLEIERLLDSPWIDYFAGPPSYNTPSRETGGSGLERAPLHSVLLHGKLWFDEVDNGYLQDKHEIDFVRSRPLGDTTYLSVFQRSLWLPMVQGCGLWLYDFGPHRSAGWWDGPMYLAEIKRTLSLFRKEYGNTAPPVAPVADALIVWDPASFYTVKNVNASTCLNDFDAAAEDLLHSGVAMDHIYLFDLQRVNLKQYKAVLFMNAWVLTPRQRQFIRDSVAREGRTLIWNYGSGFSDGQHSGKALMEQLTGIQLEMQDIPQKYWVIYRQTVAIPEGVGPVFLPAGQVAEILARLPDGRAAVAVRKPSEEAEIMYTGLPIQGAEVFRQLFQQTGCHIWSAGGDVLQCGEQYLLWHASGAGNRSITLISGKPITFDFTETKTQLIDRRDGGRVLGGIPGW